MRTYDRLVVVCVQVRPAAERRTAPADLDRGGGRKESSREVPVMVRCHGVWAPDAGCEWPRCDQRQLATAMTAFRVLHGEFDPGSGRTLAACLTHASGATN